MIALAADHVAPELAPLLDFDPQWQGGMTGVMQLAVLAMMASKTTGRGLHEDIQ